MEKKGNPKETEEPPKGNQDPSKGSSKDPLEEAWKRVNESCTVIERNSLTGFYRCTAHKENANMPAGGAAEHFRSKHGLDIDATPWREPPKDLPKGTEPPPIKKFDTTLLETDTPDQRAIKLIMAAREKNGNNGQESPIGISIEQDSHR